MFALRRAAARAVFIKPTRQVPTLRPTSCLSSLEVGRPILSRSFHQSWRWLAGEENQTPAERAATSPAEAEPSEAEMKDAKPESTATSEIVGSALKAGESAASTAQETAQEAKSTAGKLADQVQSATTSAAQTVSDTASNVARAVREEFPPRTHAQGPHQPSKIIYVGNLFFEVTTPQLEGEFGQFGEITDSRVVTDNRGLSKGFGYIEFASQNSADRAVRELDQKQFQGRRMAVQYHLPRQPRSRVPRESNPPNKTLFIGNMSYQMSDRDLNDLFKEIRNVLDVRVAIDRRSGQPRGFAHADFIDIKSAEEAKTLLEQKVIYGRMLRVDFSASSGSRSNDSTSNDSTPNDSTF